MKFRCLFALLLLGTGCDLLLTLDRTPPVCVIHSPADSSTVSGIVEISAEAFDSVGVVAIEFYADGTLFAKESSERVTVQWDTRQLTEGTWHQLFCIATDLSGNKGYSDTIHVKIATIEQRNVFHGQFTIADRYYQWVEFDAVGGETIIGDARTATSGTISRFLILDQENFTRFRANQPCTPLYEQQNSREVSLSYNFSSSNTFYLVFVNTTGTTQTYWARFLIK